MKSKVALVDVRLQNIAQLIATADRFGHHVAVGSVDRSRWMHRCSSCMTVAHAFFHRSTGQSAHAAASHGISGIYKKLLISETDGARAYLRQRLHSRGLSANEFFENISRLPASATDYHRTNALMWALNGLAIAHRVSTFRADVHETPCKLCGSSTDTLLHLVECPVVRDCVLAVVRQHLMEHPEDSTLVSAWPPWGHFPRDI